MFILEIVKIRFFVYNSKYKQFFLIISFIVFCQFFDIIYAKLEVVIMGHPSSVLQIYLSTIKYLLSVTESILEVFIKTI